MRIHHGCLYATEGFYSLKVDSSTKNLRSKRSCYGVLWWVCVEGPIKLWDDKLVKAPDVRDVNECCQKLSEVYIFFFATFDYSSDICLSVDVFVLIRWNSTAWMGQLCVHFIRSGTRRGPQRRDVLEIWTLHWYNATMEFCGVMESPSHLLVGY